MTTPTVSELVAKHMELLAYVEEETAKFDEAIKPYREAIDTIKGAVLAYLQEQNLQNVKVPDVGTAYQSTIMSVKVDNPTEFLEFVKSENQWGMLSPAALKEPVREYLDKTSTPPPGLKIDFITKCNIRRS